MGGGRFCADHQCRAEGCAERRDSRAPGAEHCALHLCLVEGCTRPAAAGRTRCENHRYCAVEGCREWIYVAAGADGDVRYPECEKRECRLYPPTRAPLTPLPTSLSTPLPPSLSSLVDPILTQCPLGPTDHLPRCLATTLAGAQCDRRVRPDNEAAASGAGRWCDDHACGLRSCPNPRPPESLQYCSAHRCGAGACQEQARRAAVHHPSLLDAPLHARLLLAGGVGAGAGALGSSLALLGAAGMGRFCAAHSCQGDGGRCGGEVVGAAAATAHGGDFETGGRGRAGRRGSGEAVRFCSRHECSRGGCRAEATHWSRRGDRGGLCDRHYRKRRDGAGAGAGCGFGPGPIGGIPMPMPMPMGMGMGFPPFFGGPGYDSSESSSDSDDGRRPRGLPFGGPFF